MRIKNNLEFQIRRYQSRATFFDIFLTEALALNKDFEISNFLKWQNMELLT